MGAGSSPAATTLTNNRQRCLVRRSFLVSRLFLLSLAIYLALELLLFMVGL